MKSISTKFLSFAVLAFVLFAAAGAALAQQAAPEAATATYTVMPVVPRFDIKDIYGRVIKGDDLKGWIIVYGFGNENNADQAVEWLSTLSKQNIHAKGILYVLFGDVSKFHRVLQPTVRKELKKNYEAQMDKFYKELAADNITIDYKLEERYIVVADTSAAYFDLFGIGNDREIPHMFIADGTNKIRYHFTTYSDAAAQALSDIIAEQENNLPAKTEVKMTVRKRQMWKRYALIGVLGWVLIR